MRAFGARGKRADCRPVSSNLLNKVRCKVVVTVSELNLQIGE